MDGSALYQRIRELECGADIPIVFVTGTAKDEDPVTNTIGISALHSSSRIPIVFVTGTAKDEDLKAIQAIGANALLSKPFSPRRLQTLIKELLELE